FAGARFGYNAHHLTAAAAGALKRGLEHGHVAVAPDEARQASCPRAVETGAERPHPLEVEEPHRFIHALDLGASQVLHLEVTLDKPRRVLGETDVPRFGQRLPPLRQ